MTMVIVGGLIAAALIAATFVLAKNAVPNVRERMSVSMLIGAVVLLATGGFYISESVGYLTLGGALAGIALLLGFEAGA